VPANHASYKAKQVVLPTKTSCFTLQNTLFYFINSMLWMHRTVLLDTSAGGFSVGDYYSALLFLQFQVGLKALSLIMAVSKMKKKFGWLAFFHYFCMLESVTYHV